MTDRWYKPCIAFFLFAWPALAEVALQDVIVDDATPGWSVIGEDADNWTVEDGMLICSGGKGGYFYGTEQDYTDFILDFEYKLPPGGNSGVFIRASTEGSPWKTGIEAQILDDYAEKHKDLKPGQLNGSLYLIAPAEKQVTKPAGEWNHMRITVDRDHFVVEVNSETVVDADSKTHPEILKRLPRGRLGFQNHGTKLWFRNIRFADLAAERLERSQWWRDAKFGLFIHWGVYSVLGHGEWIMQRDEIPAAEYEKLPPQFNPVKFDADEWVSLAKQAGQKYIVITSKHHDGFAMFDSKVSEYDIIDATPFNRDPLKELAEACEEQDIRLGFYHSILDWHHPDYDPIPKWDTARQNNSPELENYLDYMAAQVRELCTGYGDLACLWWDGAWAHTKQTDTIRRLRQINAMIRELQPLALINNRALTPEDFSTPEQYIPPTGLRNIDGSPMQWENCITLTTGTTGYMGKAWWGYDKTETVYKTPEFCIRMLIDVVSKGGNLLLNVGPTPEGTITPMDREVLLAMGRWLEVNGDAIYGTTASPFKHLPFYGKATVKEDTIFLHVYAWPEDDVLRVPGVENEIDSVTLLATGEKLSARPAGNDILIALPPKAPDPIASVIALKLKGKPLVKPVVIQPEDKGIVTLPAASADIRGRHGQKARYEQADGKVYVGNWINKRDYVTWEFEIDQAGDYHIELQYSADTADGEYEVSFRPAATDAGGKNVGDSYGGNMFDVAEADVKITAKVEAAPSFAIHKTGSVTLSKGRSIIAVRANKIPADAELMKLRSVRLIPTATGGQ